MFYTQTAPREWAALYYELPFVLLGRVDDDPPAAPRLRCAACGGPLRVTGLLRRMPTCARGPPGGKKAA